MGPASTRHIDRAHRMADEEVIEEFVEAGFVRVAQVHSLPNQHLLRFRVADP